MIKLECLLYTPPEDCSPEELESKEQILKKFNLPTYKNLKFPHIMSKPLKIDIT